MYRQHVEALQAVHTLYPHKRTHIFTYSHTHSVTQYHTLLSHILRCYPVENIGRSVFFSHFEIR